jgi:L-aspartate oxidase
MIFKNMTNTISQSGKRYHFDVVVIGSGIAALSYILELLNLSPTSRIALVTKTDLQQSNSFLAQGGIAAAFDTSDNVSDHIDDTLLAGDGLCEQHAVETILKQGRSSVEFLQNHGVEFAHDENNQLQRSQEAGHQRRRIYYSGDQTGAIIINALLQSIKNNASLTFFEQHTAINLISNYTDIIGIYALNNISGLIHIFTTNIVVLATGGAGKVYRYTSNSEIATGDGVAMAYRAGARVKNLEFYQFHPTLLYHPQKNNFLISEALRGEGAMLRSAKNCERFMQHYAASIMELATRDIVARAIFNEIERGDYDFVYLDIRHKEKKFLQQRFPIIYQTLFELGLDLSKDLIPVVPAAHYMCGGIITDVNGRTDLNRLYAIGETAVTGLHGANRLASNSLLEGVVMGRNAARDCLYWMKKSIDSFQDIKDWKSTSVIDTRRQTQISAHWQSIRSEMTSYAGIVRTAAGLEDLLQLIALRKNIIEKYYWNNLITRDLIELRNIILIAELIAKSALQRQESCGNHYREDFCHSTVRQSEKINEVR